MIFKRAKKIASTECASCGYNVATVSIAFCPGCGRSFIPAKGRSSRHKNRSTRGKARSTRDTGGITPTNARAADGFKCTSSSTRTPAAGRKIGWFSVPQMLYQTAYKWFVYLSALDVVLTWIILLLGGREVNVIADAVIATGGLKGILIYKFCLVVFVVLSCEVIGRRRPRMGHNLARAAIAITAIPVVLSIAQLF